MKARRGKQDYIKLKSYYTAKGIVNRMNRQPTEWEIMLVSHTFDKSLIQNTQGTQQKQPNTPDFKNRQKI